MEQEEETPYPSGEWQRTDPSLSSTLSYPNFKPATSPETANGLITTNGQANTTAEGAPY